jgi:hypothetical protein
VEIDWLGEVTRMTYGKIARGKIVVAKMEYTREGGLRIVESLPSSTTSRTLWGLRTQEFHRVSVLMRSPNHWDGEQGVGNRHYFLMLDGCANDGQARGFYNEFLRADLDRHRRVIEIVGARMRTEQSTDQLSGLGFSDTRRAEILVRVRGNFTRTLKVQI